MKSFDILRKLGFRGLLFQIMLTSSFITVSNRMGFFFFFSSLSLHGFSYVFKVKDMQSICS